MQPRAVPSDSGADAVLARHLARRSADLLLDLRARMGHADPDALRVAGDRGSHELIIRELALARPADAVLSEEGADDPVRLGGERVWIVDPLDGTREFGVPDRTDWAVHIALWVRGHAAPFGLAAAAVALPAQGVVLCTDPAPTVPPRPATTRPRLVASGSRTPAFMTALAADLDADLTVMGSAGAKIAAVVAGTADAYVHTGGQHEWDSAAPVAVAAAAGLHASRVDGSPLVYNQRDTWLPDLVVCRPEMAGGLLAALAAYV